ncbi:hypothetical protein D3C75_1227520 [compost metagenome]
MVFHDFQRFGGEHLGAGSLAVCCHDLVDGSAMDVDATVQRATQVTVSKDPGQLSVGFQNHGHAQAFAGHFH